MAHELVELIGKSWSREKTLSTLGAERVEQMTQNNTIMALPTSDGTMMYPLFQFQKIDGVISVHPMLAEAFRIVRECDSWGIAVLLHTPAEELDGETPMEWIAADKDPEQFYYLMRLFRQELS